jgi:hypothetical protein
MFPRLILETFTKNGGFHGRGGAPIGGVFIREKPLKWMITGVPLF